MTSVFVAQPTALARIPLGAAVPLGEATDQALLREAILLATREVPARGDSPAQEARAACTRRGYEIRLRSRTTPHGVFAGVAPARFKEGPTRLRLGGRHRARTTPSALWLAAVCEQVVEEADVLPRLTLHTSTLLARHGQRYHSEQRGGLTGPGPQTTTVRVTEVMSCIIEAGRDGVAAAEVIEKLRRRWPQATIPMIARTLVGLIRAGALLHDLLPEDPREDPLGHLLERLPAASPRRPGIARLRELLAEADQYPPGAGARWASLSEARDLADQIQFCERPLRADTVVDATLTLPVALAREAAEAAGLLWKIGWGSPPLQDHHEAFRQRYGINRAVPLLEATDPVVGLGCAEGAPGIGSAVADARREAVLSRMLAAATAQGRTEVSLCPDDIGELQAPAGDVPPRTAEIYVRICTEGKGESTADRMCLALWPTGGSQDAGSTTGRFHPLLPDAHNAPDAPLPDHDDVAVVAELVVLPRTFDSGSVSAETGFAEYRIPVGVPARPGDLLPEDLSLASNGRCLIVWSARLQRQVIPVVYSRLASELMPPLARLLSLVGQGDARPWHGWSWRQEAPFQPAVRHGRVLLAPARWVLPPHLTRAVGSARAWDAALTDWRAKTRPAPPDVVVTDDGDRQLPLELDQPQDRELLRRYVRRGLRAVTAPLPDHAQAVLPGPAGHHLVDLVISLRRSESTRPAPLPAPRAPRATGTGWHLPGSHWLSLSVRAPAEHHDAILCTLGSVAADTAEHWDRWFWLRYHDSAHGPHLRIRFQGRPQALGGHVLPALAAWGGGLRRQCLSGGYSIEPYEQETERYGGPGAIAPAEDVFCVDSALALSVLSQTGESDQRLVIAALSAAGIARSLSDTPSAALGGHRLDRAAHRRAAALRPQVRAADHPPGTPTLPKTLRDTWTRRAEALVAYKEAVPAEHRPACASDLIHLHCNRLVPGAEAERLARFLAADMLAVQAHAESHARSEAS